MVLWFHVATMLEVALGIVGADRTQRPHRGLKQRLKRPGLRLPKQTLHLGVGFLYGVHVRRVGRSHSLQPLCSMSSLTHPLVCTDRLSISTICPAFRLGS